MTMHYIFRHCGRPNRNVLSLLLGIIMIRISKQVKDFDLLIVTI